MNSAESTYVRFSIIGALIAPLLAAMLLLLHGSVIRHLMFAFDAYRSSSTLDFAWQLYLIVYSIVLLILPCCLLLLRVPTIKPNIYFLGWMAAANLIVLRDGWQAFAFGWTLSC